MFSKNVINAYCFNKKIKINLFAAVFSLLITIDSLPPIYSQSIINNSNLNNKFTNIRSTKPDSNLDLSKLVKSIINTFDKDCKKI